MEVAPWGWIRCCAAVVAACGSATLLRTARQLRARRGLVGCGSAAAGWCSPQPRRSDVRRAPTSPPCATQRASRTLAVARLPGYRVLCDTFPKAASASRLDNVARVLPGPGHIVIPTLAIGPCKPANPLLSTAQQHSARRAAQRIPQRMQRLHIATLPYLSCIPTRASLFAVTCR